MIHFVVPRGMEFGLGNYLERMAPEVGRHIAFLNYEDLPGRTRLPAGTYIFSSLDQLTDSGKALVASLQAQLCTCGLLVLNRPERALERLQLLQELERAGLNRHGAIRAAAPLDGIEYPVFLREEFRHTGPLSPLLHSRAEVEAALGRAVLRGHRLAELLVVEFCDTSAGGRYRKYAAMGVGGAIIPRSLGIGDRWMLKHEELTFTEPDLLEEREYVLANPHEQALREIFQRAGLEYGRIDYGIKDGRVETWEINTNPTVGPGPGFKRVVPEALQGVRQPAREEFNRRMLAAMQSIDLTPPVTEVPIALEPADPRDLVRPVAREGALVRVARHLGPLRWVLNAAAQVAAPVVGRLARRRASP